MTGRTVGGVAYTLVYDVENRLQQVKQGSTAPGYTYDADGNRVKAVMGSSTTVYVGAIYEKTTSGSSTTITKYYQAGGQRIALRVNGVVRWLATDHLGSTALTASETGGRLSEIRYKPWGESRYTFGATPTQRRFTGQVLDEVAGGLYFYNARYYDPALGRFAQGDTLIPNAGNPQNLNRYSYALNNPCRFTDRTGFFTEDAIEAYLRGLHGDDWINYWQAWKADDAWWSFITSAHANDIFAQGSHLWMFTGQDEKQLTGVGIVWPGEPPKPRFVGSFKVDEFFHGDYGMRVSNLIRPLTDGGYQLITTKPFVYHNSVGQYGTQETSVSLQYHVVGGGEALVNHAGRTMMITGLVAGGGLALGNPLGVSLGTGFLAGATDWVASEALDFWLPDYGTQEGDMRFYLTVNVGAVGMYRGGTATVTLAWGRAAQWR